MAEGVRVYCFRRNVTAYGQCLELAADSAGSNLVSSAVDKQKTGNLALCRQPFQGFLTQSIRKMQTADFTTLCIEINIAQMQMLRFNLNQFTDPGSCTGQEPHNKIPQHISAVLKSFLKCFIVFLGNDIVQEGCLLGTDNSQPEVDHLAAVNLFKEVQITVDSVYPVIHCGCFVVPDKIVLKAEQMIDCQVIVQGMIKSVGSQAAANRIRRGLGFFR